MRAGAEPLDTFHLHAPPTVQDRYILGHDDFVRRLIIANQWRRPIYFTSFALQQLGWVQPYLRTEGFVHRLMPLDHPPTDTAILITNLFGNYSCRGYADPHIVIEPPARWVAQATYVAFLTLTEAMEDSGRCEILKAQMLARIPLERIDAPEGLVTKLGACCTAPPVPSH
jgi:hypothetical protein